MKYKVSYDTVQFKPEFIDMIAKKQTECYMRIIELDDAIAQAELESKYASSFTALPLYYLFVPFGAVAGALIGLMVARALL